jgi:hypothetical protein
MHGNEAVSERLDCSGQGSESRGGGGVGADGHRGRKLLEEGERGRGDTQGTLSLPYNKGIVQLLGDCCSGKIPGLRAFKSWLMTTNLTKELNANGRYHPCRNPLDIDLLQPQRWTQSRC